jgi:hypothetical protein
LTAPLHSTTVVDRPPPQRGLPLAWYVYETNTDDVLAGPFLTSEEAYEYADHYEAAQAQTEVGYQTGEGDVEDDLRRALALGQGDDMNDHDTDHH